VASFETDPRIRVSDHLASEFLSPGLTRLARSRLLRWVAIRFYQRRLPGAYPYTIARTRHIDAVLRQELENDTRQVVILGAGYDSRAYRFHGAFPAARFFEVDFPATSERKVAKVAAVLGGLPAHVSYAPVDLTVDSLDSSLAGFGYDPGQRTLFIWEGVTMYLTASAVDDTLAFVANQSGAGSSIIFDYVFRSVVEGNSTLYGAAAAVRLVRRRGEPFRFGIEPGEVAPFLGERGLECVSALGPAELERIYLTRSDGALFGRVVGYWAIAHGRRTATEPAAVHHGARTGTSSSRVG
jgi:methyltransferase (TIGR00027 family)